MSVQNWPISRKLAASFAFLIATFAGVSVLLFSNLSALEDTAGAKERAFVVSSGSHRMMSLVLEQMNAVRGFTMLGKEEFFNTYRENRAKLDTLADELKATTPDEEQKKNIDTLMAAVDDWQRDKLDAAIALARNPARRTEAQQLAGVKQLGKIRDALEIIETSQDAELVDVTSAQATAQASARRALWGGGLFAILLAVGLGWLLSRGIAGPVARMTGVMKSLSDGDNHVEVPATDRADEIGAMAKAVLVFREAAVAKQQTDAARTRADAAQKHVVDALTAGLSRVSTGDLTASIDTKVAPEYAAVKTNFNEALASLRQLIGSVTESAASIRSGSGEIASASEDLARRTESNAASLEETSAAITQIDGRLKAAAVAAARTVERADGAIHTVSGGRAVADRAVQAMSRVADSAKGIDSVIEGVDKIAFQTRVLAMNAAVEAGRAGEAGRGFAVVADLVSALAMRAEEEAKRARDQLFVTQTEIVTAVDAVQKVDGALADISGDVSTVHDLLATMAADNQAQSTAITQVAAAVETMDRSTQQNAAMVEETSAAARTLSAEVTALSDQAAAFDVGERSGPAARNASRMMTRPAEPFHMSAVRPLPAAAVAALTRPNDDRNTL